MNIEVWSRLKKLENKNIIRKMKQKNSVAFVSKAGDGEGWESFINGNSVKRSHPEEVLKALEKAPFPASIVFVEDVPEYD